LWCITKNKISTITSSRKTFTTRISGRYFCNVVCSGAAGAGGGGATGGIPNACGANGIPPPLACGIPACIPGAPPIPGIPGGMAAGICGIAGGFGICGGDHAGPAGAGGGAAAGIPCALCKSRSAEPEITRVNSPGPDDIGGGALGGNDGGVAQGEAGTGGAAGVPNGDGAGAAGAANGAGASGGGTAGGVAADAPGCASDWSNCVNPPAAAGAAGGGGAELRIAGTGVIVSNEAAASGGSLGFGSWFRA